jgi:pimeloyl-ACP methyl ester carboxylesterase
MSSGFLDRDDVRLWYEELGRPEGAPVLLVMGGGGSVVWWPPELIQGLVGAGYRVIQFDSRDVGLSTHVDAATAMYGIDAMAGDAMAVLDVVGINGAHLVGVSMGGMVCLAAALLHPHRVRSLALISSTPGPDPRLPKGDGSVFACFDHPAKTVGHRGPHLPVRPRRGSREGHPEGDAGPLGCLKHAAWGSDHRERRGGAPALPTARSGGRAALRHAVSLAPRALRQESSR